MGVTKMLDKSICYYEKSANLGYVKAEVEVGKAHLSGRGLLRDLTKAREYLERAAAKETVLLRACT